MWKSDASTNSKPRSRNGHYTQDYLPLADFFENAIRRRMEAGS
jgi:hypothetical protein